MARNPSEDNNKTIMNESTKRTAHKYLALALGVHPHSVFRLRGSDRIGNKLEPGRTRLVIDSTNEWNFLEESGTPHQKVGDATPRDAETG